MATPVPKAARRRRRWPPRPRCLDLAHYNPTAPCPYCDPAPNTLDPVDLAARLAHRARAEDLDGFGWPT